jgi:hypothetical protein
MVCYPCSNSLIPLKELQCDERLRLRVSSDLPRNAHFRRWEHTAGRLPLRLF